MNKYILFVDNTKNDELNTACAASVGRILKEVTNKKLRVIRIVLDELIENKEGESGDKFFLDLELYSRLGGFKTQEIGYFEIKKFTKSVIAVNNIDFSTIIAKKIKWKINKTNDKDTIVIIEIVGDINTTNGGFALEAIKLIEDEGNKIIAFSNEKVANSNNIEYRLRYFYRYFFLELTGMPENKEFSKVKFIIDADSATNLDIYKIPNYLYGNIGLDLFEMLDEIEAHKFDDPFNYINHGLMFSKFDVAILSSNIDVERSIRTLIDGFLIAGLSVQTEVVITIIDPVRIEKGVGQDICRIKQVDAIIISSDEKEAGAAGKHWAIKLARKNNLPYAGFGKKTQNNYIMKTFIPYIINKQYFLIKDKMKDPKRISNIIRLTN